MKTTVLVAVVLALVMCVAPVWSQGGPGRPGGPGHGMGMAVPPPPPAAAIDAISQSLGLTADQATALKALLTADETKIQPLIQATMDADKALHDALIAADFESAVTLATDASNAQLEVVKANIAAWAEIQGSGILTADQFTKLMAGPGPGQGRGCQQQSGPKNGSTTGSTTSNSTRPAKRR